MNEQPGAAAFIADVKTRTTKSLAEQRSTRAFILEISDAYAFIRLQDWRRPHRFLKQMAGEPPIKFGTTGFKRAIVDDQNPARHYTAFVFVGYWLSAPLAVMVLWAWEILGFFRYRFRWSWRDLQCGYIGIRHGRLVRRHGPSVLAPLIERDLVEEEIGRLGD
ncbi:MAG: hypothetical protein DYG89_18765 [Caldilinea sp. CFX5]|nr:hypothetical protein [Caldilinea sp. CFX5]